MSQSQNKNCEGPYIVWENYGYEGWKPTSYPNLEKALMSPKYCSEYEITKLVEFVVEESGKIKVK